MKVLIVSHGHPDQSRGGAQIASYSLFRQLRQTPGVRAYYLARFDRPGRHPRRNPIFSLRGKQAEWAFYSDTVDAFLISQQSTVVIDAFSHLLREIEPDVVHFHHYTAIGVELIAAVRRLRPQAKIVVTLHEFMAICHHLGQMVKTDDYTLCRAASPDACAACFKSFTADDFRLRETFIKSHFDKVDRFIAPSAFLRERYVDWGLPDQKVVVLDNGVPPVSQPSPRTIAAGERRSVFGFFGQIHPFKGLLPLLSAFAALDRLPPERTPGVKLRVHGTFLDLNPPEYVEAINDLLARTAERVTFVGAYDAHDLDRLMSAIDWVVVPSVWWENSPLVIQEGFTHRRPVICGDIGGMAEKVRSGKDGFHFSAGNPAALVELILRLVDDPAIWDRLQDTIAEPSTIAVSASKHIELYRS